MRPVLITIAAGAVLSSSNNNAAEAMAPYGFQSGAFPDEPPARSELLNDDTYPASMYYDPLHSLLYIAGSTYGTYFDSATDLGSEIKGAMGMSDKEGGRDTRHPHLGESDCFLGILKLPQADGPMEIAKEVEDAPWLINMDSARKGNAPELIYARRFGTARNSETCSSVIMLPKVNDALLQTSAQLKLALLGHVNPTPLSSADVNAMGSAPEADDSAPDAAGGGERQLRGLDETDQRESRPSGAKRRQSRELQSEINRGGFLHSLSQSSPVTQRGRSYGFAVDFDLSLTADETFTTELSDDLSFKNAYGALLGGYVLENSPLVYPTAMAQNTRDPNQIYVVSMHSDDEDQIGRLNPEYAPEEAYEELDGETRERADATLGGAGTSGSRMVGGVPKYGSDFYVKVQQLSVTPYERLMDVEPTADEKVKRTMEAGWGFGFKLNDANDVRPSAIVFVKGRTPNEDILLLGGTTRKGGANGERGELDGFITKLVPPAPSPVEGQLTGGSPDGDLEDERVHPTKRIDSTTGRDETVTAICLPPPNDDDLITHAFVVGSTTSDGGSRESESSLAYVLKLRLDDLSTVWKEHVPSVDPSAPGESGGDVLGEGCAVSPDGKVVYLGGTIDGSSAIDAGILGDKVEEIEPIGGKSDVFVAAFDVKYGKAKWARQLGTEYADKLARGGGVACDNEGNVVIMGGTRGAVQRYREVVDEDGIRGASDVFVMSLGREDGAHVNAPYVGGPPVSSPASDVQTVSAAGSDKPESEPGDEGGSSDGMVVMASLMGIVFFGAIAFFAYHNRRRWSGSGFRMPSVSVPKVPAGPRKRHDYSGREGDVLRGWDNGGDDFSYDNRALGGRRSSDSYKSSPRMVKGFSNGSDEWDDGENIRRKAAWMLSSSGGGDDGSVNSSSSRGSYKSRNREDNSDFLASLRREANATMKRMVKDDHHAGEVAEDPRLDGGASIKSLLTHYREVKKGTLFDDEGDGGGERGEGGNKKPGKARRKPPPPPPPRRKKGDQAPGGSGGTGSTAPDGLSEFTIV